MAVVWTIVVLLAVGAPAFAASWSPSTTVIPHKNWKNSLKPKGISQPAFQLAKDGKPAASIVLPGNPDTKESKAAEILRVWLKDMTGAEFSVVREPVSTVGNVISIGNTSLLKSASILSDKPETFDTIGKRSHLTNASSLAHDGMGIAVEGRVLYLFGGNQRGVINAVVSFLEEDLGCRWYSPGSHTIPFDKNLSVSVVNRTKFPAFHRRDPYYTDVWDIDYSLLNKTTSVSVPVPIELGGYPKYAGWSVHSYNGLVPPSQYFATNPEYFAEINGVRRDSQLCTTNPELQKLVIDKIVNQVKACPDCRLVDFSPNDWRDYCECKDCKALNDKEGAYMGALLPLVNKIAEAVSAINPDIKVTVLAYLGTVHPPKTIRPHKNVQITLCVDAHSWPYPFLYAWETEYFQTALKAWDKVGADIMIWEYPADFVNQLRPWPNVRLTSENMRFYHKNGADGILLQAAHSTNRGADRSLLRSWVSAKQMFDLSRETEPLIEDFYLGYYGSAGEELYNYDKELESRWKPIHDKWKRMNGDRPEPDTEKTQELFNKELVTIPDDLLDKWDGMFAEQIKLAGDNKDLVDRLEFARMPLRYLVLDRGPTKDTNAYLAAVHHFEGISLKNNVEWLRNGFAPKDRDLVLGKWRSMAMLPRADLKMQPLSNEWKFKPVQDSEAGRTELYIDPRLDDSKWATVRSDLGHKGWEGQGFEAETVGYGWYRQTFQLDGAREEYPNLRMFFGAADEQAEIWINGKLAFEHTSRTMGLSKDFLWNRPFQFDPVPFLNFGGENQISVRVHNLVHVGGIWRPVYLIWGAPVSDLEALVDYTARVYKTPW